MTPSKRFADLCLAITLTLVLALPFAALCLYVLARQGRPLFYRGERMRSPTRGFQQVKLRTMTVVDTDSGVSGADKTARITPLGHKLRRYRLDEIPQLWNILRGDMSFVGPRPPLREYVERFPEVYAKVLQSRPGLSGVATLIYNQHESALLARCATAEETDAVYTRACVPRKARLDMIYGANRHFCWDAQILWHTLAGRPPRPGAPVESKPPT